jgi:hypothetical protein
LPSDEELQSRDLPWIATVSDNEINYVLIAVQKGCGVCSVGSAEVGCNATCMESGYNISNNMLAGYIVLNLFDYFVGAKKFRGQFVGAEGVRCLQWIPEDEVTRLKSVVGIRR